jgi:hypothetical protein
MKSKQLRPVIYTGKVGAKLKPLKPRVSRATKKTAFKCQDGPMKGHYLYLSGIDTMMMNFCGHVGRYVAGKWEVNNA